MADTLVLQEDCVGLQINIPFIDNNGDPVSIEDATGVFLILKSPAAATSTKTGSIVGDGTGGVMQYALEDGDIDTAGTWQYQGKVTYSGGIIFFSEVKRIKVKANL